VHEGFPAPSPTGAGVERQRTSETKQFFRSKHLVGADVKDSKGKALGNISEVLISPESGQAFAAVSLDRNRHAIVPLQALNVKAARGKFNVTLNKSRETLASGPLIKGNQWGQLDDPGFTQRAYSHYNLNVPPSAVGGSDGDAMGGAEAGKLSSDKAEN
jgi:hypothetical protein